MYCLTPRYAAFHVIFVAPNQWRTKEAKHSFLLYILLKKHDADAGLDQSVYFLLLNFYLSHNFRSFQNITHVKVKLSIVCRTEATFAVHTPSGLSGGEGGREGDEGSSLCHSRAFQPSQPNWTDLSRVRR